MKQKHSLHRALLAASAILLLLLACSLISSPTSEPPEPQAPLVQEQPVVTEPPAPTPPPPTEPPPPVETEPPTPETPSCYKWDQITVDMAGETVCVYGKAFSHQGQSRIDFSPEKNSFFLIDTTYYYPNLSEGACVAAEEKVEVIEKIPFMTIKNGLYECLPWMLEE